VEEPTWISDVSRPLGVLRACQRRGRPTSSRAHREVLASATSSRAGRGPPAAPAARGPAALPEPRRLPRRV